MNPAVEFVIQVELTVNGVPSTTTTTTTTAPPSATAAATATSYVVRRFIGMLSVCEGHNVIDLENFVREKLHHINCAHLYYDEILTDNDYVVDDDAYNVILKKFRTERSRHEPGHQQRLAPFFESPQQETNGDEYGTMPFEGDHKLHITVELKHHPTPPPQQQQQQQQQQASSDLSNNSSGSALPQQQKLTSQALNSLNHHNTAANATEESQKAPPQQQQHQQPQEEVRADITQLVAQARRGTWFIEGTVNFVKRKNDKICEVEIFNPPGQYVTCVSYDASVSGNLEQTLAPRKRIEIHNAACHRKSPRDIEYATNPHPLKIILDAMSRIVVVAHQQPLGVFGGVGASSIAPLQANIVVDKSSLSTHSAAASSVTGGKVISIGGMRGDVAAAAATTLMATAANPTRHHTSTSTAPASFSTVAGIRPPTASSSASSSGMTFSLPKRTLFVPQQHHQQHVLVSGGGGGAGACSNSASVVLSVVAGNLRGGVVTAVDTQKRDRIVDHFAAVQEIKEARRLDKSVRQRQVSHQCIICGYDLETSEGIEKLKQSLLPVWKKLSGHKCTFDEFVPSDLAAMFIDRSGKGNHPDPTCRRIYCDTKFLHPSTRKAHLVHARCAHIATEYQRGNFTISELQLASQMEQCDLCEKMGAVTKCYHPDCNKIWHSTCALYSQGHVNFGIRDPRFPCAACPTHTQVQMRTEKRDANGASPSSDENNATQCTKFKRGEFTVFDSSVVDLSDLRDPDDEEEH